MLNLSTSKIVAGLFEPIYRIFSGRKSGRHGWIRTTALQILSLLTLPLVYMPTKINLKEPSLATHSSYHIFF